MSDENDPSARFLPRIREELDKLPLNEEQKAAVIPALLKQCRFLDTNGGKLAAGNVREDSSVFDFEAKIRAVFERFAADGLTTSDYLKAAVKQASLFYQSPETVAGNITGLVERFAADGLTARDYLMAAVKQPQLFTQSPETVAGNIIGLVERFAADGLTARDYLKAAVKQPSLFATSPETVPGNITGVVERFAADGLTARNYLMAAVKQPSLFAMSPETVAGNITGVVERFAADGLTTGDYLKAAVKQPPLFAMSPETVAGNITGLVERFATDGLTTSDYLKAAVKQPQLFYQSPETIGRHIDLIIDLHDKGVFTLPVPRAGRDASGDLDNPHAAVLAALLTSPKLLTLEDNNYVLREFHQRMTGAEPSPENLRRSRHQTEHELMRHLGHDNPAQPVPDGFAAAVGQPPTEEQAKRLVLRALAREGYIKGAALEQPAGQNR